jgi:hypothetical protein
MPFLALQILVTLSRYNLDFLFEKKDPRLSDTELGWLRKWISGYLAKYELNDESDYNFAKFRVIAL